MKYFLTISFLFLFGLSEYSKPQLSSLSNFQSQKGNDTLDTLKRLCELLSGSWALVGHKKQGIWQNPDTLVLGFGRTNEEQVIANFDILTDSGLIYLEMNYETRKILKVERKPVLQLLKLHFDEPESGRWNYINDYDSITSIGSLETCQPIPNLVEKSGSFYIHLVGLVGESDVKIDYISKEILVLGDEKSKTVYRRFSKNE